MTLRSRDPACLLCVFDVAQGDSIAFRLRTGEIVVIDCNVPVDGEPPALRQLREWTQDSQPDIEVLCLTHPDADHYRGMIKIIEWVHTNGGSIKNLILPVFPTMKDLMVTLEARRREFARVPPSREAIIDPALGQLKGRANEYVDLRKQLLAVKKELSRRGGLFRTANGFSQFLRFGNTVLYILGPTSTTIDDHSQRLVEGLVEDWLHGDHLRELSTNAISCILWLIVGQNRVMLTADTTAKAWTRALDEYDAYYKASVGFETRSQLVKAPHHGAKSGSSPNLWERVLDPQGILVISAGNHAGYHHPHQDMIDEVRSLRPEIFCTNICPRHAEKMAQGGRESLAEVIDWQDSAWLAGVAQEASARGPDCYHGTCTFEITEVGDIVARPTLNPRLSCSNHVYA